MTLSQNDTPPNESGFPTMPNLSAVADAFKALDDETRLRIFWLLRDGEKSVGEIAALMKMSCPAVCHHLKQLKIGGLLISRRDGKEVYYTKAQTTRTNLLCLTIEGLIKLGSETSASSLR